MNINVNKIEELLEKEFEFLIHDYGYYLDKSSFLGEIDLKYKAKKREIHIHYDAFNYYLYVDLTNTNIFANLFCGGEGELGFNSETITKGDMKWEDIDQYLMSEASDDINLNLINFYKKIMLAFLPDVLKGKKWIRLKQIKQVNK